MAREMDPSRLISCAEAGNMISVDPVWDPAQGDQFDRRVEDAAHWRPGHMDKWYELFDVLAANMYIGNYGQAQVTYLRYVEMFRRYNKPLILSEFGHMSLRGADCDPDQLGSEKRHSRILKEAYSVFAQIPELVGYCPWCLCDVRVPIHWRWFNHGKGVFRYGLLDENWEKKEPYFTLKEQIAGLKDVYKK